ncbi:spindle pole body component 110-like [Daucus carota subsp. sativus]|uniref:spindle pole body component 110-like n=1 Tax=Daucus carota subsp. sativus TaxID=79200 RepID=UPI0007F00CB0|nr:PREDICTED: spindle pole body component 110-like [Daucus carota subsp. sativus]
MSTTKQESLKILVLNKADYPTWKVKIILYHEAADPDFNDRITDGPHVPKKLVPKEGTTPEHYMDKTRAEMTREERLEVLKDSKNRRALLIQDYERYETNPDEVLTDTYDHFLTLLNNLSLTGKEYEAEDSNTKFLRSLPEEWDTQSSIKRHPYDLSTVSLDEVYRLLKTRDLEIQQRKAKKVNRDKSLVLITKTRKEVSSYAEKPRNQIMNQISVTDSVSVTDNSSGDDEDDSPNEAKIQEIMACIAKGQRKVKFGRDKRKVNYKKDSSESVNEKYGSKVDWSKIKCFNCEKIGHFAKDCTKPKSDGGKGKALFTSTKDWMKSSSESEEEEVNYALVVSFEETQTTDDPSVDKVQQPVYNFKIDDTYTLKSFLKSLHLSFKTQKLENTRLRSEIENAKRGMTSYKENYE